MLFIYLIRQPNPLLSLVMLLTMVFLLLTQIITVAEESQGQAPEFTWGLMSLKVMDGEEVKFHCEVSKKTKHEHSLHYSLISFS